MEEKHTEITENTENAGKTENAERMPEKSIAEKTLKEQIYDRIHVPIWLLDLIIAAAIIALIAVILIGRSRGTAA